MNLTEKEKQILHCMARGLSPVQVAKEVALSRFTVNVYATRAKEKLGAINMHHAIALFVKANPEIEL